jgi:hypothetical protein
MLTLLTGEELGQKTGWKLGGFAGVELSGIPGCLVNPGGDSGGCCPDLLEGQPCKLRVQHPSHLEKAVRQPATINDERLPTHKV